MCAYEYATVFVLQSFTLRFSRLESTPNHTLDGSLRLPGQQDTRGLRTTVFSRFPNSVFYTALFPGKGVQSLRNLLLGRREFQTKVGWVWEVESPPKLLRSYPEPPPTPRATSAEKGAIKEGKFSLFTTFLLPFHSVASSSSPPNEKGSWVQQPAVERKEEKRSGKVPGSRPFPATSCNEEEEKWVGQLLFFFFRACP